MTIPPFEGTGDVQEYLRDFEQIAQHNKWETNERGLQLKLNLTGKPRVGIDDTDYPTLKALLLEKYGLTDRSSRSVWQYVNFCRCYPLKVRPHGP